MPVRDGHEERRLRGQNSLGETKLRGKRNLKGKNKKVDSHRGKNTDGESSQRCRILYHGRLLYGVRVSMELSLMGNITC